MAHLCVKARSLLEQKAQVRPLFFFSAPHVSGPVFLSVGGDDAHTRGEGTHTNNTFFAHGATPQHHNNTQTRESDRERAAEGLAAERRSRQQHTWAFAPLSLPPFDPRLEAPTRAPRRGSGTGCAHTHACRVPTSSPSLLPPIYLLPRRLCARARTRSAAHTLANRLGLATVRGLLTARPFFLQKTAAQGQRNKHTQDGCCPFLPLYLPTFFLRGSPPLPPPPTRPARRSVHARRAEGALLSSPRFGGSFFVQSASLTC